LLFSAPRWLAWIRTEGWRSGWLDAVPWLGSVKKIGCVYAPFRSRFGNSGWKEDRYTIGVENAGEKIGDTTALVSRLKRLLTLARHVPDFL
jgi:hypothetical protein